MEAACIPALSQGFRERAEAIVQQVQLLGNGYVKISSPGIDWFIYGKDGRIVYLSNSIEPFERLSRVLRGCLQNHTMNNTPDGQLLSLQIRSQFEQVSSTVNSVSAQADYQVLAWMSNEGHLSPELLQALLDQLNLEVMESLCQLPEASTSQQSVAIAQLHPFAPIDFQQLHQEAETRLKRWHDFQPELFSPYQRPYFSGLSLALSDLSPEYQTRLRQILIGFSWRQIAMLMNQDELSLAEQLLPLIRQDIIRLRDPFSPFDQLPWQRHPATNDGSTNNGSTNSQQIAAETSKFVASPSNSESSSSVQPQAASDHQPSAGSGEAASEVATAPATKTWQVVCIDDSPAVLNEINRCLGTDMFSITLIEDSKKALMKINSIKPDIILLDANMPGVDGYQVCTMLRKSNKLKHIPVIMVTGNRGLVNRAKAKMAGITDYLNKPFSQKELLEMVFRHLSE